MNMIENFLNLLRLKIGNTKRNVPHIATLQLRLSKCDSGLSFHEGIFLFYDSNVCRENIIFFSLNF